MAPLPIKFTELFQVGFLETYGTQTFKNALLTYSSHVADLSGYCGM